MKTIPHITLLLLLLCNCNLINDTYYGDRAAGHTLYYYQLPPASAIDEIKISTWIYYHISYEADPDDIWKDPQQTIADGCGDCEDFCILFMNLMYIYHNIKCDLVLVDYDNCTSSSKQILDGGYIDHAIIRLNERYFDPILSTYVTYSKIGYLYTFDEVFN
jgi:hypothetical protein